MTELEIKLTESEIKYCEKYKLFQIPDESGVKCCGISKYFPKCPYFSNIMIQLKSEETYQTYRLCKGEKNDKTI